VRSRIAVAADPLDRALAGAARATDDAAVRRWLQRLLRDGDHAEGVVGRGDRRAQETTRPGPRGSDCG
jgi:hypothetical protein